VTLRPSESDCLDRYCALLRERLGAQLVEVRLFGSAARGDMWAAHSPMNSDIDVLVVTSDDVAESERHFFSEQRLAQPESERTREFLAGIGPEAVTVWPR